MRPEKERYEDSSITLGRCRQRRSGTPPVRTRIQTRPVLYQDRYGHRRVIELYGRRRHRTGYGNCPEIRAFLRHHRLAERILGERSGLYHRQGKAGFHPQSGRDVQQAHQVRLFRRKSRICLRQDCDRTLCLYRRNRREGMAGYRQRPGEGPDRFSGPNQLPASLQTLVPARRLPEA